MPSLTSLDVRKCVKLRYLPISLGSLPGLVQLLVTPTLIKSPPSEIVSGSSFNMILYLRALHAASVTGQLVMKQTGVRVFPPELVAGAVQRPSPYLKEAVFPDGNGKLSRLTVIDLSDNQIRSWQPMLGCITSLTSLVLAGNRLSTISSVIANLTRLTHLDLSGCNINDIPDHLYRCNTLTSLNLCNNNIASFGPKPCSLSSLSHLQELHVAHNPFVQVPQTLVKLTLLTNLDIGSSLITGLPRGMHALSSLQRLILKGCDGLLSPPREMWSQPCSKLLSYLGALELAGQSRRLELVDMALRHVPMAVLECGSLTAMNLSHNSIKTLPPQFSMLASCLSQLDLSYNNIQDVTPCCTLTQVTTMDVSFNPITQLPSEMQLLSRLSSIRAQSVLLTTLPDSICTLVTLTSLDMNAVKLRQLPCQFSCLTRLQFLDFDPSEADSTMGGEEHDPSLRRANIPAEVSVWCQHCTVPVPP